MLTALCSKGISLSQHLVEYSFVKNGGLIFVVFESLKSNIAEQIFAIKLI